MGYLYDDEDNAAMNDPFTGYHNPTVYLDRAEMEYYESGQADRDREEAAEALREKFKRKVDGVLDFLGLEGGCRECAWITEPIECFLGIDNQVSFEQLESLKLTCVCCPGKGTGKISDEHEARLTKDWCEFTDWVKELGLTNWRCKFCRNVYEVYGHYKDPDDEWKAIENLCEKCQYFGEG